jgi:hypothetical protein
MTLIGRALRLIPALVLGLGALFLVAPSAGATTQQQMVDLTGIPIDIGPAGCGLVGDLVITGNGHDHFFTNGNGDFWENATVEGQVTLVDPVSGAVLETGGHGEAWFGIQANNGAQVMSFKASVQLPTGRIQQNGHFTVNANGVPVVSNSTAKCG